MSREENRGELSKSLTNSADNNGYGAIGVDAFPRINKSNPKTAREKAEKAALDKTADEYLTTPPTTPFEVHELILSIMKFAGSSAEEILGFAKINKQVHEALKEAYLKPLRYLHCAYEDKGALLVTNESGIHPSYIKINLTDDELRNAFEFLHRCLDPNSDTSKKIANAIENDERRAVSFFGDYPAFELRNKFVFWSRFCSFLIICVLGVLAFCGYVLRSNNYYFFAKASAGGVFTVISLASIRIIVKTRLDILEFIRDAIALKDLRGNLRENAPTKYELTDFFSRQHAITLKKKPQLSSDTTAIPIPDDDGESRPLLRP